MKTYTSINPTGFTLIEILVVATIMGLLVSGSAVIYSQFVKQSRDVRRKADLEQVREALEMYRSNENSYPLPPLSFGTGSIRVGTTTYIDKLPQDPKYPANSYYYTSSGSDYTIASYLETGGTICVSAPNCSGTGCNYCLGPYGQK